MNIKNFLLLFFFIIIALAFSEISLRYFYPIKYKEPIPKIKENKWNTFFHKKSSIQGLNYELNPNAKGNAAGTHLDINSHGMRDKKRKLEKGQSVKRIAVIGDSFTFGFGVSYEKLFPTVLEDLMNDSSNTSGYRYEVLNFGVGGYSCRDEAAVLEHKIPKWDPDLVIITYVMNDADMEPNQPLHRYFHETELWQYSHVCRLVASFINDHSKLQKKKLNYMERLYNKNTDNWKGVVSTFKKISKTSKEHNLNLAVMIFTQLLNESNWENYSRARDYQKQVIEELKNNEIKVVDLYDMFSKHNPSDLRISAKDGHPNEFAHSLTANYLMNKVLSDTSLWIYANVKTSANK